MIGDTTRAGAGDGGRGRCRTLSQTWTNADEPRAACRPEIEPTRSEPVGLVLLAQAEGLGYAPPRGPALEGPFTVVRRRERPHDLRCDNGAGVADSGGIDERPLQGRGTSVVADPGRCPGLGEAALQAACLSRLILGADRHLPCGGTPATDPPGRVPARERFPNYASRVFLKIDRRR